jgi:thiol-disulfide isomerase/thioredoxin
MISLLLWFTLLAAPAAAPEIPLLDLDDRPAGSIADFKGHAVVLNFWASWCKPCQIELPELQKIALERAGQKVKIITVNLDSTGTVARKYIEKKKMDLPAYRVGPEVLRALNLQSVPVTIVFNPEGQVAASWEGLPGDFTKRLNTLLDSM